MKLYDALQSTTLRRSAVAAGILALAGGASAAFLARSLLADSGAAPAIAAFLLGAALVGTPAVTAGLVLHAIDEHQRQTAALTAIRPLMGHLPLTLGRWAIDAHFGQIVANVIIEHRPSLIVECGSGSSTVIAAECLRRLGHGRVVSFEHDAEFAEQTRRNLAVRGLETFATVVTAPIAQREVDGDTRPWYGQTADARIDGAIDLLIVDGPPRQLRRESRLPAVPLLEKHLSSTAIVLMDDGNRPDESRIAGKWARRIGASKTFVRGGKGAWILRAGTGTG